MQWNKVGCLGHGGIVLAALALSCSTMKSSVTKSSIPCAQVRTINTDYSRTTSRYLIREITVPTRANLDFAAYSENIMLYDSAGQDLSNQPGLAGLPQLHFQSALDSATLSDSLSGTPLISKEICLPMSWPALREYLLRWDFQKSQSLVEVGNRVAEENWGNDGITAPIQEITRVYLHEGPHGPELWAKIEVKPWAKAAFPFLHDEDGDGFRDFYGRLNTENAGREVFDQIANDYREARLDYEGVVTWGNELASFWYPTYNTDMGPTDPSKWEGSEDDRTIAGQVQKWINGKPVVVIRGKPFGVPLYNLFLLDGVGPIIDSNTAIAAEPAISEAFDKGASEKAIETVRKKIAQERSTHGQNDFHKWDQQFAGFKNQVNGLLKSCPVEVQGIKGNDNWIFLRRSLDYLVAGDLSSQRAGKNPIPVIVEMKKRLQAAGIDFLFVPIPPKPEVYPEKLVSVSWTGVGPYVNPYSRKFMTDLADSGIEVVDLLEPFLAEKAKPCQGCEPLYQLHDTHWTSRGLELAAGIISQRIKQYRWNGALEPKVALTEKAATFQRMGDIVQRLPLGIQTQYRPATLSAHQVLMPDGTLYKDQKTSSILVLGDSFCGVYQRTDCKHAGISAHIAKQLQYPVHLIMSYGGGPTVISQLKSGDVAGKKLVVWMMTARDLNDYWEDWKNPEF